MDLPRIDVRRAASRSRTVAPGLETAHSLSFGRHYEPDNASYGVLVAHNDEMVAPGAGYPPHRHREVEVVTWVLQGTLLHRDDTGRSCVVRPGTVQRLSAGRGVTHAETCETLTGEPAAPVRFVQVWLLPSTPGDRPEHEVAETDVHALAADLVPVASGRPEHAEATAVRLRCRDAALHVARLAPGRSVRVPDAPWVHVFVATGAVTVDVAGTARRGDAVRQGDAVRLTRAGGPALSAVEPSEVLVWEMHATLAP